MDADENNSSCTGPFHHTVVSSTFQY